MRTVYFNRPTPDGFPVTLRFPACGDACAAELVDQLSQPVYEPYPFDDVGRMRAVRRPAKIYTAAAAVGGACRVCGSRVEAVPRSEQTDIQMCSEVAMKAEWPE